MNPPITLAIIDDEVDARELAKIHLRRHPHIQIIGEAEDGLSAIHLLAEKRPTLVLLDIQMPGRNGLEVLQQSSFLPQVIFITAYDSFAIRAFELNAVDYLLKPFTAERFDAAIQRALKRLETPMSETLINRLLTQLQSDSSPQHLQRLIYRKGQTTEYIPVKNIRYIRAADQYVEVYTDQKSYLIRQSMDYLERQLPSELFFRTHRSAIVAISAVKAIHQDEFRHFEVHLHAGVQLPLSQVRKALLIAKLRAG